MVAEYIRNEASNLSGYGLKLTREKKRVEVEEKPKEEAKAKM